MALAGVSARRIEVAVNGQAAGAVDGLVYNATINRDGTIPGGGLTNGIIYDYLRLEVGA